MQARNFSGLVSSCTNFAYFTHQNRTDYVDSIPIVLRARHPARGCHAGRRVEDPPARAIREAYDDGHRIFGESHPQELREKYDVLPKDIEWHMIGHLQTNKVKYIAPFVSLIHSVDSVRLAETIQREAAKCGRTIEILLEIPRRRRGEQIGLGAG